MTRTATRRHGTRTELNVGDGASRWQVDDMETGITWKRLGEIWYRYQSNSVTFQRGKVFELEAKTRHVHQITEIITSVAHRTNLLSLNASIEAARAGEASCQSPPESAPSESRRAGRRPSRRR